MGEGFIMAGDCNAIVGPVARGTANIEDTGNTASLAAVATGELTLEMAARRRKARSQVLWMVDQARDAAKHERVEAARWWHEKAIRALWNLN
jgi:hypothetical protein